MRTLFLPHTEVVQRLDALSLLAPMREGFIAHSRGRTAPGLVQATSLPAGGIARVTGVGLVPDLPAYSVSSAATSPDGVEQATLLLHDLATGKLLACLEAVHLRAIALALGIAIAADVLARPEASRVAVLGTSDGTLRFLKMLRLVRSLRQIRVLEPRPARAEEVAGRAYRELSLPVRVSQDVEDAVQDAELVLVTAGAALLETVPEGCHVAVVDPALRDSVPAAGLLSESLRWRDRNVTLRADTTLASARGARRSSTESILRSPRRSAPSILVWSMPINLVVRAVQRRARFPRMTFASLRVPSCVLTLSIACVALPAAAAEAAPRDGQHDFDFAHGKWKIRVKKLKAPLKGSKDWVEFTGTSVCRPFWGGAGNLDELVVDGPDGRIDAITLRMYSPTARQWSLNWATKKGASFGVPTVGEFRNGRGEFYDQEAWEGRTIFVRYVWSDITTTSAHFEQAFSDDGGKTWEVNWITDQTRVE